VTTTGMACETLLMVPTAQSTIFTRDGLLTCHN
jgi:hypothetical protein